MERHVYFVRHGETDTNLDTIIRGPEAVLTEKGIREAHVVSKRIASIGVDALITGPHQRTVHTAQILSEHLSLPVEQNELFAEIRRPSIFIGRSWRDKDVNTLQESVFDSYEKDTHFKHSDEENFAEIKKRAEDALEFLAAHSAHRICVVSSSIFMGALLGSVLFESAFSVAHFRCFFGPKLRINNTGITHFQYDEKHGWQLVTWNDSAHLG